MEIPKTHPRYESLKYRHMIVDGLRKGFVAEAGLIAHGRGEAFDYLLGEKTAKDALVAQRAACCMMLLSDNPVISVNGNTAALVPGGVVELSRALDAKIEVNLFYRTPERERIIESVLREAGATEVLGIGEDATERIPGLDSERARADPRGIYAADTVLVPLEDGDRVEALAGMGKNVICIDLNPLSRSATKATLTIVDNIVRAVPNMTDQSKELKSLDRNELASVVECFDNQKNLADMVRLIRSGLPEEG